MCAHLCHSVVAPTEVRERGSPIGVDLGSWKENSGLQLSKSRNRWDRRTDLMGTTFVISDSLGPQFSFHLDLLHFLDGLNLTIGIRKGWTCVTIRKEYHTMADVCGDWKSIENVESMFDSSRLCHQVNLIKY